MRFLEGWCTESEGLRLADSVNGEGVMMSAGKSPVGSGRRELGIACGSASIVEEG